MVEWLGICSHGHVGRADTSNMEAATFVPAQLVKLMVWEIIFLKGTPAIPAPKGVGIGGVPTKFRRSLLT